MSKKSKELSIILGIVAIVSSVLLLLVHTGIIFDTDSAWHYKVGELVSKSGIPTKDTFSIHKGLNFMAHEWLFDVFLFHLKSAFGYKGVIVADFIFLCLAMLISVFYSNKNVFLKSVFFLLFILLNFHKNASFKPDTVAVVLVLLSAITLMSDWSTRKKLIINGLIVLLIANIHGGMLVTVVIQSLVILFAECITKKVSKTTIYCIGQSIIFGCINPYGIKIYTYWFKMLFDSTSVKYIIDWQPYHFNNVLTLIFLALFIALALLGGKDLKKFTKETVQKYALICMWLVSFLWYQRCINIFLYFLIMLCGDSVVSGLGFLVKDYVSIFNKIKKILITVSYVVVLSSFTYIALSFQTTFSKNVDNYITDTYFNKEMLSYLNIKGVVPYNFVDSGGYLIYLDKKVFIDGRIDPYIGSFGNKDILLDSVSCQYYMSDIDALVRNYNINVMIVVKGGFASELLLQSSEWTLVTQSSKCMLFALSN